MDAKQLIKDLRDYADLMLIKDMPYDKRLLITDAVAIMENLLNKNKQLRNDLIMQTALAQNGQSAIETNQQLTKKLQAALKDIKELASASANVCDYCKNYQPCDGEQCQCYQEGVGCTNEKGEYVDWKWTCRDFDYGTCPKMEDSPCNGCMYNNDGGFEWRGN